MSKKGSFLLWSLGSILLVFSSSFATATILNYYSKPVAAEMSLDKISGQSAQQNLSQLIFENDELETALSKGQTKILQLENQVTNLTSMIKEFEGYCDTQSHLFEAELLYDDEKYDASLALIHTLNETPMSENTRKIYTKIQNALAKKGYK